MVLDWCWGGKKRTDIKHSSDRFSSYQVDWNVKFTIWSIYVNMFHHNLQHKQLVMWTQKRKLDSECFRRFVVLQGENLSGIKQKLFLYSVTTQRVWSVHTVLKWQSLPQRLQSSSGYWLLKVLLTAEGELNEVLVVSIFLSIQDYKMLHHSQLINLSLTGICISTSYGRYEMKIEI